MMTEPKPVNRKPVHVVETDEVENVDLTSDVSTEVQIANESRTEIRVTFWLPLITLILMVTGFVLGALWLNAAQTRTIIRHKEIFSRIQRMEVATQALAGALAARDDERATFLKIVILRPKVNKTLAQQVARYVLHYSRLRNLDPDLMLALIDVESAFIPDKDSHVGARGLMQLMPHWEKIMDIQGSLDDPETSIRYGTTVFAMYLNMYRDVETAIAVYNQGPNQIDWDIIKNRDPTAYKYVNKVMKRYRRLKTLEPTRKITSR